MSSKQKKKKTKCKTPRCRREKHGHRSYCNTCNTKMYRERHPIKYVFDTLKKNALRRSKVFTITLDYFTEFIQSTDYMERKGREKKSLTIDRIKNELGYIPGNLRIMSNEDNRKAYVEYFRNKKQEEDDIVVGDPNDVDF